MADESYPMTPAGRDKLRARLKQVKDVERFLEGEGDRWGRAGRKHGVRPADRRGVLAIQAHGRETHDGEKTEPTIH